MIIIKHILLDLFIKNQEAEFNYNDIPGIIKNNNIIFEVNEDKYLVSKGNSLSLKKENKESILLFNFNINKKEKCAYYIKEMNLYLDCEVKALEMINKDNKIYVKYILWLQDELIGEYEIRMVIKK